VSTNIHDLIMHYGYFALLFGCLAEGETFVLLGGIAAHQGLLNLGGVIAATMLGGIIGDQLLFWIGNRYGSRVLEKFTRQPEKIEKAKSLINRHPAWFIIGTRFMYGFRIIGPILIGSSGLSRRLFLGFNILGAALWSLLFTSLGFFAGKLIEPWMEKIENYLGPLFWVVAAIVIIFVLWKLISVLSEKKRRNSQYSGK
jgi:membrane protein DedA with SNARE-associated domain